MLQVYAALTSTLLFSLLPFLWCFGRSHPRYRAHFRERLGFLALPAPIHRNSGPLIWIHAASLGEVKVAAAVTAALKSALPDAGFIVSTVTPHGRRLAEETFGETAAVVYAPLDAPACVYRALHTVQPDVLVLMETEIWPLWITMARRMGVRTAVLNGRISPRSIRAYLRLRPLFRQVLDYVDRFSMITIEDAERIRTIGAKRSRIVVNGNAKFDILSRSTDPEGLEPFRRLLGIGTGLKVIVAGSTRGGEEEILLEAFGTVCTHYPETLLIIAPRHLERVPQIEQLIRRKGFEVQLRSGLDITCNPRTAPVVLLDTYGELFTVYGLATLVFCGGSLVPMGGQNPLEPAAWGKAVLYGPSMDDFKDARALLEKSGAGQSVENASAFAQKAVSYFNHPEDLARLGAQGREAMLNNRGATKRHARVVLDLLAESPPKVGPRKVSCLKLP